MKIAIASTGRFHVLDLARELSNLGHEVAFYSYVPHRRAIKFGLPSKCHRSMLPFMAPLLLLQRIAPRRFRRSLDSWIARVLDWFVSWKLEPCDVLIAMSGTYVKLLQTARKKYGAKIYLERGSQHILAQRAILDNLQQQGILIDTVPNFAVVRELAGYIIADRITIPSLHVERSFLQHGVLVDRLFRNHYGVDLTMFPPTTAPDMHRPTLLFVGTWCYQKGVDVLTAAWQRLSGIGLMHVGSIGDAPLPVTAKFTHIDPVPQWRLHSYYAQAHLFILASRQDGFGMVLSQALACGLPIVCTDRTGGEDLQRLLEDPAWIKVVSSGDIEALVMGIRGLLPKALTLQGKRDLLGSRREQLTWVAYGRRYATELTHSGALANFNPKNML